MSFIRWLQTLRSALASGRGPRKHGRGALRAATYRPSLEVLEDRCLLSFSPAASFPVGTGPVAVATADFNNDGNLDLATANNDGDTTSVLLGDGRGGFGAASHFAAGFRPRALAVGDFNNDGNLDLTTAHQTDVSVRLGNGDGTFQPPVNTGLLDAQPLSMAVADFNADGKMDLVVTTATAFSEDGAYINVLFGDGGGGFSGRYGDVLGTLYSSGLAVADFNADGRPDVAVVDADSGAVVLLGNGDGTLQRSYGGEFFEYPWAVAAGDFTDDGISDLVTVNGLFDLVKTVRILPGNGDGTFASPIRHNVNGVLQSAVAAADFNGDGLLDAITAGPASGTASVFLGRGDGTLNPQLDFAAGSSPRAVAVGDFNGDGRTDAAAANAGSNTVSVLLNDDIWPAANAPQLQIGDVTLTEGNTGTRSATFTVTLSAASSQAVTVVYATANGTATAGSDYQATGGTLTFAPGQTSKTITVPVIGDRLGESNETFVVNLSSPTNAVITDGQGVGSISDDEPRISIGDVTRAEGRKGQTTLFTFTVTLSAAYDQVVTMSYRTLNGTATSGTNDYVAKSGTLTFAPGETTKTITIEVKGDSKREASEMFYLDLFGNSLNALFTKKRGIGTILNDD